MSRRIVRRRAALEDLVDQTAWYITHASQAVADRFNEAVERALQALLATPGIGAPRPRANPALRSLRMFPVRGFENHLLFYRPIRDGIELIRVLHGMRDIEAILKAEPDPGREGEEKGSSSPGAAPPTASRRPAQPPEVSPQYGDTP